MLTKQELKNPANLVAEYIAVKKIDDPKVQLALIDLAQVINHNYTLIPK